VARERLEERAVHGDVLAREQRLHIRSRDHGPEEDARDVAIQEPLAIFREGRRVPRRRLEVDADEPPDEQVVLELLAALPLGADRVEHLHQHGTEETLGRHRGAADAAVERLESRRQLAQDRVDEAANRTERGDNSRRIGSTKPRIARSGWSAGIRSSRTTVANIRGWIGRSPRIDGSENGHQSGCRISAELAAFFSSLLM
jgi:hypothetical protein